MNKFKDNLGKPNLQIQGLNIWIHRRQFPDELDYWDGNWLVATAHCIKDNSEVWIVAESILRTPELLDLKDELERFQKTYTRNVELLTLEPYLSLKFESELTNLLKMKVRISPDLENYKEFIFEINKNDLEAFIGNLKEITIEYPVRGKP